MPTNLWDFLPGAMPPHTANVIPFRDGCNWTVIQIPAWITCQDVLSCIDCAFIWSLFNFTDPSIVWDPTQCALAVDSHRVNDIIAISFDCNTLDLIVWTSNMAHTVNLGCILNWVYFTFTDWSGSQIVHNLDVVTLNGRDGLGFWLGNWGLNVSLPNPRTNWQVLTWSDTLNSAYRANPIDVCCDRVYSCMEPIIASLQNQINILAGQLCPCGTGGSASLIDIYDEGALVQANVQQINFIGSCINAVWNNTTHQADVTVDILSTFDCNTNLLNICGTSLDLSCLRTEINVYDEWSLVQSDISGLNFVGDCISAAYNAMTQHIDVTLSIAPAFDCSTGILTICWSSVSLACLSANPIIIENTVFVTKNGNDGTGLIERLDKPFLTITAAISAAVNATKPMTVMVYPGTYAENMVLKNAIDVHLMKWMILQWQIQINDNSLVANVTWDGDILMSTGASVKEVAVMYWIGVHDTTVKISIDKIIAPVTTSGVLSVVIYNDEHVLPSYGNKLWFQSKNIIVWDGNIANSLDCTLIHMVSEDKFDIQLGVVEVANYLGMFNMFESKDPHLLYFHHSYLQETPAIKAVPNTWAKQIFSTNLSRGLSNIYLDNIYIDLPINSFNSGLYDNAFIYSPWNQNSKMVCNDCLWILNGFVSVSWVEKVFSFGSKDEVNFLGNSQFLCGPSYAYSLYTATTSPIYNAAGRVYANKPYILAGMWFRQTNGTSVNHVNIDGASTSMPLRHPGAF